MKSIDSTMNDYEYVVKCPVSFNVTTRNCSQYLEKCLKSIVNQCDDNWSCVVTDDASDDGTWEVVKKYEIITKGKIKGIRNTERLWKARNFHNATINLTPYTIVIELDGDDYLIDENVVSEIRRLHQTYDLVWTQHEIDKEHYVDWHSWTSTLLEWNWTRNFPARNAIWNKAHHPGHLRTFKKFLYDEIPIDDFMFNNKWVKTAFDCIYYTALIEMTEPRLRYFYDKSLLIYNVLPHNDTFMDFKADENSLDNSQSFISEMYRNKKEHSMITQKHIVIIFCSICDFLEKKSLLSEFVIRFPKNKYHIGVVGEWSTMEFSMLHGCKIYNIDLIRKSVFGDQLCSKDIILKLFLYYLFRNNWTREYVLFDEQALCSDKLSSDSSFRTFDNQGMFLRKFSFDTDYLIIEESIKDFKSINCCVFGKIES